MRLSADGRSLEAVWVGDPAARALVFLHEGLGSLAQWRDFPARVSAATGLSALVYSRAGYGRSDPVELPRPLDYMEDEGTRVLPEVLRAAGVTEPILFGHSDGASIALVYAAVHGAAGLALEAAHVFCEEVSVHSIAEAREAFLHGDLRGRLERHHSHVDAAFWGWNRAWLDPAFRQWNIEAYLPRVRAPVLVMQARDDPYGTLAQVDAIARQVSGPATPLVFEEGGHTVHRTHTEATVSAVAAWLARVAQR